MPDPIVFRGPNALPGDTERAIAAVERLQPIAVEIINELGADTLLDAMLSMWLDLHLKTQGSSNTDKALRDLRRDLPRIAAALRAANGTTQGDD